MSVPRLIPCVLALATLTLGACSASAPPVTGGEPSMSGVAGGKGGAVADGGGVTTTAPGTDASPSPSTSALTAEAYKGELDGRYKAMLDAIDSMASARSVKSLNQRVGRAEEAISGAADALSALTPPAEVQAQHDAYVAGLRDFATELGSAAGKVGSRDLCTSSAVLADIGDKLAALDRAGEALQKAGGYRADVVDVKAGKKQTRRLSNGVFARKDALNGRSSLEIDNGGDRDAVVTLVRGGTKVFSVYVRKKGSYKVRGVRDGTYKIYFTHGVDWDGRSRQFTRRCSFEKFQKTVKFKTTFTATQILWHDWKITLHSIAGGNAKTSDVDPEDFPA